MGAPVQLIVGLTANFNNVATFMDNLVTAINTQQNFTLTNSVGQLIAVVTAAEKILQPISVQANTFAAATQFLSIMVKIQEGKKIEKADVLTLAGNVLGVVGQIAIMADAPVVGAVAIGAGVVASLASVAYGDNLSALYEFVLRKANDFWGQKTPVVIMIPLWWTLEDVLATQQQIMYEGLTLGAFNYDVGEPMACPASLISWEPDDGVITIPP
ncbi:hypothetical protein ACLB1G_15750 [Oxalobacteraceae bacterium A2-2]